MRSIISVDIWDAQRPLHCVHSKFTQALFHPRASYKLKRAPTAFPSILSITPHSRTTMSPLRTSFTLPSLSLVSCCVPFPFTGTLKVRGSIHVIRVPHSKNLRAQLGIRALACS